MRTLGAPAWRRMYWCRSGRGGHRLDVDVGERRGVVGAAQARGGVARQQAAAADQRDLLAQLLRLLEVVRGEEDRRPALMQAADVGPQLEPQLEVHAGRRL